MLQVKNLTKIYDGGVLALDDVSFEVPDGEFLAVIGLSGSGKSTLLRCINRLIEPTAGTILWNGEDITAATQEEMRRIRRRIGMVFQHFQPGPPFQCADKRSRRSPGIHQPGDEPDQPFSESRHRKSL